MAFYKSKLFIMVSLICLNAFISSAQSLVFFKVNIKYHDGSKKHGILYEIKTDTLVIVENYSNKVLKNSNLDTLAKTIIPTKLGITKLSLKRNRSFLRNIIVVPIVTTVLVSTASYFTGDYKNSSGRPHRDFFIGSNSWESRAGILSAIGGVYLTGRFFPFYALPRKTIGKKSLNKGFDTKAFEKFSLVWQLNHSQIQKPEY